MAEQIYGFEALNLVMVCVDEEEKEEYKGRLYHQYREEPIGFDNILQMIKRMEELYDTLNYPQASTKARCFVEKRKHGRREVTKVTDREKIFRQKGELGTLSSGFSIVKMLPGRGRSPGRKDRRPDRFEALWNC